MADNMIFIILDGFADWEYAPLAAVLQNPEDDTTQRDVLYTSIDKQPKTSIGGLKALPDLTLEEIPDDAAGLILIGGTSWRTLAADAVAPIAKRFLEGGKLVGAICDAARFLAAHGLLNQYQHTGNFLDELKNEAAYTNPDGFLKEEAVRDRNLVTANGNAPYWFAREVLLALGEDEKNVQTWYDFYTMGFHQAIAKYFPDN